MAHTIQAAELKPGHVIIDGPARQYVLWVHPVEDGYLEIGIIDSEIGGGTIDCAADEDVKVEAP